MHEIYIANLLALNWEEKSLRIQRKIVMNEKRSMGWKINPILIDERGNGDGTLNIHNNEASKLRCYIEPGSVWEIEIQEERER